MSGGPPAIEFRSEMGITHREFLRTLRNAVEGRSYQVSGQNIDVDDGDRRIRIELSDQWERRIATIRMPVTNVTWRFIGHTRCEAQATMARFEIFYRRGGG